jgi:hypothetical protein
MTSVRVPRLLVAVLLVGVVILPGPEVTEARLSDHVTIEGNEVGATWWSDATDEGTSGLVVVEDGTSHDEGDVAESTSELLRSEESITDQDTEHPAEPEVDLPETLPSDAEEPSEADEPTAPDSELQGVSEPSEDPGTAGSERVVEPAPEVAP